MFQVQRKQKYMHHRARERQEEKRTPRPHNIPFITRHMDDPARFKCVSHRILGQCLGHGHGLSLERAAILGTACLGAVRMMV
ncbi:MAG: hypothetical protein ACLTW9_30920 [Enterocloster sp.]